MYQFLKSRMNERLANVLIGVWYFFLLFLVISFINQDEGLFRYLDW